ncbi:hypothetical protein AJ80_02637 [Polytolypa hystricis UAMH7299]|uniref:protein disulfide-isomerase n=1 Tax=Polytolypa hystricis (strain UAMH7299) TaxID=1447883 RepID=A0A2B7YQ94_POLH7|nr:hypothetical protein AJ80_02637 [Polytolypa hystricis UAMH7299]
MLVKSPAILLIAALLEAVPANAAGIYTKKSPVLQVDASNYDRLIAKSNHASSTTLTLYHIRFYAPWCGHCQNLKPAYEKAAQKLEGLAKVAAINCDDDDNKQFCGQMGVQGFPTLKIVTPSKKPGKPTVEDYQGPRSAKGIVDALVDRIPNHVKRLTDKDFDSWLADENSSPKAILFTEKGTTSAIIRSLAIDFLGSIKFGQIRNKEMSAVEKFGISKFPTLVVLPGGEKEALVHDGEMNKKAISAFLSQVAEPNADPAPKESKASKKKKKAEGSGKPSASSVVVDDTATPTPEASSEPTEEDVESTSSKASVPKTPPAPPLQVLSSNVDLRNACLQPKSGTCVLAILPVPNVQGAEPPASAVQALGSLTEISHKHALRKGKLFPFYVLPDLVSDVSVIKEKLGLDPSGEVEIIAVNQRRGWWRRYDAGENGDFGVVEVEAWIDAIRLGEGKKEKLPEGFVLEEKAEEPEKEDAKEAPELEPESTPQEVPGAQPSQEPEPEPEQEPEAPRHEEL